MSSNDRNNMCMRIDGLLFCSTQPAEAPYPAGFTNKNLGNFERTSNMSDIMSSNSNQRICFERDIGGDTTISVCGRERHVKRFITKHQVAGMLLFGDMLQSQSNAYDLD